MNRPFAARRVLDALSIYALPVAIALLWLPFYWALIPTWQSGFYYEHGWLVGPAAAYFAWNRARDLPRGVKPLRPSPAGTFLLTAGLLAGLLIVVRVVEMVDTTWRVVLLFHGLLVAGATFLILGFAYGRRIAFYFLPVIFFALLALPIPTPLERPVISRMTDGVMTLTAEALRWGGLPVEISGQVLLSMSGQVEVTEGCSGIRSFQSLVVSALFFGELFRLRVLPRIFLVGIGILAGFATNAGRAVTLSVISIERGDEAFDRAHDPVGITAFTIALLILFFAARWFDSKSPPPKVPKLGNPGREVASPRLRFALAAFLVGCLVVAEAGAMSWFRFREPAPGTAAAVAAVRRVNLDHLRRESGLEVEELNFEEMRASEVIGSDRSKWLQIHDPGSGASAEAYLFEYDPGNPFFFVDAFDHSPELCMGSAGYEVTIMPQRVHDGRLKFHTVAFRRNSLQRPLYVYKTRDIDGMGSIARPFDRWDMINLRLEMASKGKRSPAAAVLEVGINGFDSEEDAWRFLVEKVLGDKLESDAEAKD